MGRYRYYQRYQYGCKTQWVCTKYRSGGCQAAMTTTDQAIIAFQHSHNHWSLIYVYLVKSFLNFVCSKVDKKTKYVGNTVPFIKMSFPMLEVQRKIKAIFFIPIMLFKLLLKFRVCDAMNILIKDKMYIFITNCWYKSNETLC